MIEEAKRFFQNYNEVFDSGDMKAFSKFFCEPFISVRADGSVASMPTNAIAEEFFFKAIEKWKEEGYQYFSTRDYSITPIGSESMLVTFTWEMLDKDRVLIREWCQSYNLLRCDGVWKVITSTFHS